jgi:hypothetical protein
MIMRPIKELKRLAILKWEYLVLCPKGTENIKVVIPELGEEWYACSFCTDFYRLECEGCPVKVKEIPCYKWDHPFNKFINYRTKKNAQAVLDLIKAIPEE